MDNIKEFTREEYNSLIEKNDYESFSSNQLRAFSEDIVEKSKKGELSEFEKTIAAAEYVSLEKAIVVENDLSKSLFYYRPSQTEAVELPNGIFKSINDQACHKFKETSLNILKGIVGINCADKDAIEKAKALPIGTEKTWSGKVYIKTERGWRPKKKGIESEKKESSQYNGLEKEFNHFLKNRERSFYENDNGALQYDEMAEDFCKIHKDCNKDKVKKLLRNFVKNEEIQGSDYIFRGKEPSNALEIYKEGRKNR